MSDFNPTQEARALVAQLRLEEGLAGQPGANFLAMQLRDEVAKQFCSLSPEQRTSTIGELSKVPRLEIISDGNNKPLIAISNLSGTYNPTASLPLDCSSKQ